MNSYIQTKSRGVHISLAVILSIVLLFAVLLLTMPTVHAAEGDVTTWTTSGTCEWGIDPDGCLWIRPANGVSGTLSSWPQNPPWYSSRTSVKSVVVKQGVAAAECSDMFRGFSNCTQMDLDGLGTENVTLMNGMFAYCTNLTSLDISSFDTSKATDMSGMFSGCSSLTDLDISSFDMRAVESKQKMFPEQFAEHPKELAYGMADFVKNGSSATSVSLKVGENARLQGCFTDCWYADDIWELTDPITGEQLRMTSSEMNNAVSLKQGEWTLIVRNWGSYAYVFEKNNNGMQVALAEKSKARHNYADGIPDDEDGNWSFAVSDEYNLYRATNVSEKNGLYHYGDEQYVEFDMETVSDLVWEQIPVPEGGLTIGGNLAPFGEYVAYKVMLPSYTINIDENDGSGNINSLEYPIGRAYAVPPVDKQNASGLWITGYNTEADGTGIHYGFGDVIPANTYAEGDVLTLYAEWDDEQPVMPDPSMGIVYCSTDASNFINGMLSFEYGLMYDSSSAQFMYVDVDGTEDYQTEGTRSFASPGVQGYRPIAVYECTNYIAVMNGSGDINDLIWEQTNQDPNNVTVSIPAYGAADIYMVLYEAIDPRVSELNVALILDENASVPGVTTALTLTPGTGIAAVPGTSMAVIAPSSDTGVTGTPTIGQAVFAPDDETVTSADGVTIAAGQKAVIKNVEIDFREVTFSQPGIFRYLITEPNTGDGLTYDTQLGDTTNGVQYQRVLDVYVQRVDDADTGTTSYQIAGFVLHEVADAPAESAATAADKSAGFVNEYETVGMTLECNVAGNQSSIDKYFAYTITIQNPNDGVFTVSADWTNAADALNPTANPATKYDVATITAANTAEGTSNADGSLSKTIYLRNGQKVELDGIPAGATYSVTVADEDYSPSWTAGDGSGSTNTTGNRVLNAMEDVVFTLTREGVVPTGVMLSIVPGLAIMGGAIASLGTMMKKRKKSDCNQ